ncbi:MAG: hypothetical protein WCL47_04730 [Holophagaceae bacterium]
MRLLLPVLLLVLPFGCGGGGSGASPAPPAPTLTTCPIPIAKASPSFAADLLPALQSSCGSAATSCHGGSAPTGHVIYSGTAAEIHARLVNGVPASAPAGQGWLLVKPGDPAHSWLLEKVTKDQPGGSGYGTRMPQAAPNLCQATVDTLTAWINAGAPAN